MISSGESIIQKVVLNFLKTSGIVAVTPNLHSILAASPLVDHLMANSLVSSEYVFTSFKHSISYFYV